MAAATVSLYKSARTGYFKGSFDLLDDTIKVMLVGSGYTFSADHDELADVSANEITGTGYTAGGAALAGKTVTEASGVVTFDASDLTWAGLTATMRYAVIYAAKTVDGLTNPLIACVLLDSAPADVSVTGVDWTLRWSASGILYLS